MVNAGAVQAGAELEWHIHHSWGCSWGCLCLPNPKCLYRASAKSSARDKCIGVGKVATEELLGKGMSVGANK